MVVSCGVMGPFGFQKKYVIFAGPTAIFKGKVMSYDTMIRNINSLPYDFLEIPKGANIRVYKWQVFEKKTSPIFLYVSYVSLALLPQKTKNDKGKTALWRCIPLLKMVIFQPVLLPSRERSHIPSQRALFESMIFLFPKSNMLVPWRVAFWVVFFVGGSWSKGGKNNMAGNPSPVTPGSVEVLTRKAQNLQQVGLGSSGRCDGFSNVWEGKKKNMWKINGLVGVKPCKKCVKPQKDSPTIFFFSGYVKLRGCIFFLRRSWFECLYRFRGCDRWFMICNCFGQDVCSFRYTIWIAYIFTIRCEANGGKYIPYTECLRYKVVYLVSSFVIPCLPLIFGFYIHPKLDTTRFQKHEWEKHGVCAGVKMLGVKWWRKEVPMITLQWTNIFDFGIGKSSSKYLWEGIC